MNLAAWNGTAMAQEQVTKVPRIGYWPFEPGTNQYTARMREILGQLGDVAPFPPRVRLLGSHGLFPMQRSFDVAVINWLESKLVDAAGRPSLKNLLKLVVQTVLFRAKARRLVLVRHNRYPHGTQKKYAALVSRCIDLYERLYDQTVTHSEVEATAARAYCPHPLYVAAQRPLLELPATLDLAPGYFLVFGRIERYKRLERLIERFPDNQRLLIVGAVEDSKYAAELARLSRPNVRVVPGFLSDELAQHLLAHAAAMILSHADEDMIVSGSFFYAVSFGKPVLSIATPFLLWAREKLGDQAVRSAPDLAGLVALIRDFDASNLGAELAPTESARAAFGDECIRRHVQQILFSS